MPIVPHLPAAGFVSARLLAAAMVWLVSIGASGGSSAQTVQTIDLGPGGNAYSFHGLSGDKLRTFSADSEARAVVGRIMDSMGLPVRFEIRAANVPNASAILQSDGKRLIVYNTLFMDEIHARTGRYWSLISIMAHEIGHHLAFHMSSAIYDHDAELEADYFSGYILAKMGASLDDALSAMRAIASQEPTETHPGRDDRLQAIAAGWKNAAAGQPLAGGNNGQVPAPPPKAPAQPAATPAPSPHAPSPKASAQACSERDQIAFCVSSYLPTSGANRSDYGPSSLVDGDSRTAWVEGRTDKDDTGIGEWVLLDWGDERLIAGLRILNGYPKTKRHFRINGRVLEFSVILSNGERYELQLEDSQDPQLLRFPEPQIATWVQTKISRARRGSRYSDTAINEIRPVFD